MSLRRVRRGRSTAVVAVSLFALAQAGHAPAQEIVRPEDVAVAIYSLRAQIEVEKKLLARSQAEYEANIKRRGELHDRVSRLHDELEALFRQETGDAPDPARTSQERPPSEAEIRQAAETKEIEVVAAERAESASLDDGRRLREEIRQGRSRIAHLTKQMDSLRATQPRDRDSVTGIWDISILPSGDHGVFSLWQSGTIVTGQYVLDGPFRGSLEGTLVNRQILLHRIDAKLGRSMEFSGYLSADGGSFQGTWLNYDLSSGRSPTGSWSGKRRKEPPSSSSESNQPPGESEP